MRMARTTTPVTGPFPSASLDFAPPSWSPDGKTITFSLNGAIDTVPSAGGAPTPIVSPGPGELLQRPAFAPDGTHLAYVRYPNVPVSPDGRRRDLLVVRDLTTGAEQTADDHTSGRVYMGNAASPSWSADSQRIAYIEDDFGFTPTRYRVVTVAREGSGRQVLLENNKFINLVSWDNVPQRPTTCKHVEVAQAISPDLDPVMSVDPLASGPVVFPWTRPWVSGFELPLVASKRTLLRVYVGDFKQAAGTVTRKSLSYRVSGGGLSAPEDGAQGLVKVTAPDVAADQTDHAAAINVWLPAAAAAPGATAFRVQVNPDQSDAECAGCYPAGNDADVTGVRFDHGGALRVHTVDVVIDAGLKEFGPGHIYDGVLAGMLPMLPVRDSAGGLRLLPSPDAIHIDLRTLVVVPHVVQDRAFAWACAVMLSRLDLWRALSPASPGGGALDRWVALAGEPPGLEHPCGGLADPFGDFVLTPGAGLTPFLKSATAEYRRARSHARPVPHAQPRGKTTPQPDAALRRDRRRRL